MANAIDFSPVSVPGEESKAGQSPQEEVTHREPVDGCEGEYDRAVTWAQQSDCLVRVMSQPIDSY